MLVKRSIVAVACGLLLTVGIATPSIGYAQEVTGSTASSEATIKLSEDAAKTIKLDVPEKIPFAAKMDGSLISASQYAMSIQNKSEYPVHVTNITLSSTNWSLEGYTLPESEAAEENDTDPQVMIPARNRLMLNFNGDPIVYNRDNRQYGLDVSKNPKWNMGAYSGTPDASRLKLDIKGKLINVSNDLSQETTVANIAWTFAPGAAPQA